MSAAGPADADPAALRRAIAALDGQRPVLGDAATELALAPLRQQLAQAEAAAPQLRRAQVTVLFADIVGSTALAARLDAEDVLQVFGRLLERAAACVLARGGRVLRYTGDGLKAGFGTQGTREDDAAQAVQAGLDILATAREHAAWVHRQFGVEDFAVRVGAHTGEVALGAGFEADNTLTGDTVNIAARMEQAAPAGGLRVSAETWAHVRGLFEADEQPPLTLKGLATPQRTWLVQRPRAQGRRRSARGIEGLQTRMVGRDAELEALKATWELVRRRGRFAAVTVVGDAGLGKSRLHDEFDAWLQTVPEPPRVLHGRTTPQTEGQVFGLLRDVLARYAGIADDDSVVAARHKMEMAVVPLFVHDDGADLAEAHAHLLGHLIGIEWLDSRHIRHIVDDARQLRSRALHTASQVFRRLAARDARPLLLALDDLHWADAESLGFLDQLAAACADVPLMLLNMARPVLYERHAAWGAAHRRIDLAPLAADDRHALAAELLCKLPEVPEALTSLLTRNADGNPFYMEELVKMMIDRGAILPGPTWRVDESKLQMARVPGTLTGVLQARLDELPAPEKQALQQASIIGALFWEQALAAIDEQAVTHLPALVRRRLTLPRADAAADGLHEFAFHHQMLQQVAYGTVLKQDRRTGHGKVARWMSALTGSRAGDFLGTAAEHFELAGDANHAAEFHTRAAEHAGRRLAHERVLWHVGRALALIGPAESPAGGAEARMRWRLHSTRELAFFLLARHDEQAADLHMMERLADRLDDDHRRAHVERRRGLSAARRADWAAMETHARACRERATDAGDDSLRLYAVRLLAMARNQQGDVDAGRALAADGLAEARRLGLRSTEAGLLNALSAAVEMQGDLLEALDLSRQCLEAFRETGDTLNAAICMANLGEGWLKLGDLTQARPQLESALRLVLANGDRASAGATLGHLSALALWLGDPRTARARAREALDIAGSTSARDWAVVAGVRLGDAELALGDIDAARAAYADARSRAAEIEDPMQLDADAGLARLLLGAGDTEAAVLQLRNAIDGAAAGGTLEGTLDPRRIELTCHQVLAARRDARAFEWLSRAHRELGAQAATIADDDQRQAFLLNIPVHREIAQVWRRASAVDRDAMSPRPERA